MSNPYETPQAEVELADDSVVRAERPKSVERAAALIAISLALGVVKFGIDFGMLASTGGMGAAIAGFVIAIAVVGLLAYLAWAGKSWARLVFVVLFVLGLIPTAFFIFVEIERSITLAMLSLFQLVAQFAASILLYVPASNQWYRALRGR